jgi:hypothetical protein
VAISACVPLRNSRVACYGSCIFSSSVHHACDNCVNNLRDFILVHPGTSCGVGLLPLDIALNEHLEF